MPTDRMQARQRWLADQKIENESQSVTYRRAAASVTVSAVLAKKFFRLADGGVYVTERDFLIRPADLVLSGSPATPAEGDRIDLVEGSATNRYEVLPAPDGQCYSLDPHRTFLRVHTKFIGVAT